MGKKVSNREFNLGDETIKTLKIFLSIWKLEVACN